MTDILAQIGDGTVRYEPCNSFRIRLSGDLFTCADCGWWASEHEHDEERWV